MRPHWALWHHTLPRNAFSGDTTRAATDCSISGTQPTPIESASAKDASARAVIDRRLSALGPRIVLESSATKSLPGGIAKEAPPESYLKKMLD